MNQLLQTRAARRAVDWAILSVMAVLAVGFLLPFLWLISMSFRKVSEAYKMPPSFFPASLDFSNYVRALTSRGVPFLQIYLNSVEIAVR